MRRVRSPLRGGAIRIIDGKAKVVQEELCDGAGFCLGVCPEGALSIEEREAPGFDEAAAAEHAHEQGEARFIAQDCYLCGSDERAVPLLPVRHQGQSKWVCTHCLPRLIHG